MEFIGGAHMQGLNRRHRMICDGSRASIPSDHVLLLLFLATQDLCPQLGTPGVMCSPETMVIRKGVGVLLVSSERFSFLGIDMYMTIDYI